MKNMPVSKLSGQKTKRILIVLYILLTGVLAITTFVEHARGTDFVYQYIYSSPIFCCLWGVLSATAIAFCCQRKLWKRFPLLLLHGSFLVILGGAMITYLCGVRGHLHLLPGVTAGNFTEAESGLTETLPFTLRLDSFRISYYPGTEAPADYISYVSYETEGETSRQERISMNRVLSIGGVRLYQSSYDEDMKGSWLSVNYDPWGTTMTYIGYILLGISMLWILLARGEEFRSLLRHPLLKKGGVFVLLLLMTTDVVRAQASGQNDYITKLPVLARKQADSLKTRQIIYHDRVVPFNTLARDFVQKLTGGEVTYCGFTAEQVIASWLLYPNAWQDEPMIYIKSAELRRMLNLSSPYARLSDLYTPDRAYRLQTYWQELQKNRAGEKMNEKLQKAIQETDEKVGLIAMLQKGTLIRPLPSDNSVPRLSETRVQAELFYNKVPFTKILFMCNLSLGLLAFFRLLYRGLYGGVHRLDSPRKHLISRSVSVFFAVMLVASLLFHLSGYALRWYVGGRIPLSNGHETMLFMAGCILLFACLLQRRFPFIVPFGFLLSGFALLVAYLGQKNPQITPLMPVLLSPWLSIHVSLIMVSYALFAFMMLNGLLAFCIAGWRRGIGGEVAEQRKTRVEQLMIFSRLMLYPAVFCLGAGIFIGAVWANVSWGRYWAWDPKEVWALLTFMVYGAAFHGQSLAVFRQPRFFHCYMVVAFLTVLMTYFGVNYLLGGMHSYA